MKKSSNTVLTLSLFSLLVVGCSTTNSSFRSNSTTYTGAFRDLQISRDEHGWFTVKSFQAGFHGQGPNSRLRFNERNSVKLNYITPMFEAKAIVDCHPPESEGWKIGFIQILTNATIDYTYEKGTTSWRFPRIPINDSVGTEYPWYDGTEGYCEAKGIALLGMDDDFDVSLTWHEPRPPYGNALDRTSPLTRVERDQTFILLLAALHADSRRLVVLRDVEWRYAFRARVDLSQPQEMRCQLLSPEVREVKFHDTPRIKKFQPAWLDAPTANDNDQFWAGENRLQ